MKTKKKRTLIDVKIEKFSANAITTYRARAKTIQEAKQIEIGLRLAEQAPRRPEIA